MVYLLGDLELPVRGRTYREPEGPHTAIARGDDLPGLVAHASARADCAGVAVVGPPAPGRPRPDLSPLAGRRLLVVDSDRARMRALAEAGLEVGAKVEWALAAGLPGRLPLERLAAFALPVAGLVLAAGQGRRMGADKLLLELGGRPLVAHVLEAAREGGCELVLAVYSNPSLASALAGTVTLVENRDAATGIASSLRAGLAALPDFVAGAMVLLGDQPLVGARTVRTVISAWRGEHARPAAAVAHAGGWSPPVLIGRELWPELVALTGDQGARQVLGRHPNWIEIVGGEGEAATATDVDTPDDYRRVVRLFPGRPR